MTQSALVSIVLTTLNGARYLREAIDSCLAQAYTNIELIIVDGGSTDGTLDIVASYGDRLRLIRQIGNQGKLPGAINLGLDIARGDYLTWMQDDCIYHPTAIERMAEVLDANPEVGHVYADYWQIDEQGKVTCTLQTCQPDNILKAKSDPCGVCFMIRRSVREAVGPHDVTAYPSQDYDYRLRIAMRCRSERITEPLFSWRLHGQSLTGTVGWPDLARKDVGIRLKLGLATPQQAQRDLAEIDIAYAFECYQQGRAAQVPGLVLSGVRLSPSYIRNRGVWAILVRSLTGNSSSPTSRQDTGS